MQFVAQPKYIHRIAHGARKEAAMKLEQKVLWCVQARFHATILTETGR